jgi:hypothetical protein
MLSETGRNMDLHEKITYIATKANCAEGIAATISFTNKSKRRKHEQCW